jgi:hypothetical protein
MRAEICDRCGAMWVDAPDCRVHMHNVELYSGGTSASCRKGSYDLCDACYQGLLSYLDANQANQAIKPN